VRVYLDSSVLLRVVLGQADQLTELRTLRAVETSALTQVELLRTLDRRLVQRLLLPAELAGARAAALTLLEYCDRIALSGDVLRRASDPFPTPLGTLNALHLASALLSRDRDPTPLTMATHDHSLALAAQAMGLPVLGV
jgi:predicted nucleic acid-binding protein